MKVVIGHELIQSTLCGRCGERNPPIHEVAVYPCRKSDWGAQYIDLCKNCIAYIERMEPRGKDE